MVMLSDLPSVFDLAVGGGHSADTALHEVMHAIFEKGRSQGRASRVFDTQLRTSSISGEITGYGTFISLEEIYNHLNEPFWFLRTVENPSPERMLAILKRLDRWPEEKTYVLDAVDAKLDLLRENIATRGGSVEWRGDSALEASSAGASLEMYLDPTTRSLIKGDQTTLSQVYEERMAQARELTKESRTQLQQLGQELRGSSQQLRQLASADPSACRLELLRIFQRNLSYLRRYLN
jgi:hypothetical protein